MPGRKRFDLSHLRRYGLCAALLVAPAPMFARTADAYIRVNQVGYVATATKRAYLMAPGSEAGTTFEVKNSAGTVVYSAPVGSKLGTWGSFQVYALDFDSVTAPDTYTISVTAPVAAASTLTIDTSANLFPTPLAHSLYFYESERDGPDYIPNALRTAPGHLNDEHAAVYLTPKFDSNDNAGPLKPTGEVIDASGGGWDAGDYMKFVETHSYTVAMMLVGVRDFPEQMGSRSSASNFTPEAKFGLDWLQKMWDDDTQTFYYQVAVASGGNLYFGDHDIWRLPQVDDDYEGCVPLFEYICRRPVFRNTAGGAGALISPNLAGRLAADFALCYQVFAATDPDYAKRCLVSAEHVFDLADVWPKGLLTTGPYDFYPEVEWRDDLELGASELYFALRQQQLRAPDLIPNLSHKDPTHYLEAAAWWAHQYIIGPNDAADTLNLYDVSGLAHFELYRAITLAGDPAGLSTSKSALLADLKKQLDKGVAQAETDPFGFGYPWAAYDTTSHGGGLVVMANEFDNLTGSAAYATFGDRWQANVLGANAWGTSLIVGDGDTFPLCMQHQVTNLVPKPPNGPPFLFGAAVEGPNSYAATGTLPYMVACPPDHENPFAAFNGNGAIYEDNVQSYSTVEPAIDLTASSFLGFAWEIAGKPAGNP